MRHHHRRGSRCRLVILAAGLWLGRFYGPGCAGNELSARPGDRDPAVHAAPAGDNAGVQADWKRSGVWRVANKCSVNALYIALRLQHVDLAYDDVERTMHVTATGSSLADLRACAGKFGVSTVLLRITPDALSQSALPCVAHLEEERSVTGHFVVVVAAGRNWVEYIDGTTAVTQLVSMPEFRKSWTGYVMVFPRPPWWRPFLLAAGLLGAAAMILALVRRFGARVTDGGQALPVTPPARSCRGDAASPSNRQSDPEATYALDAERA